MKNLYVLIFGVAFLAISGCAKQVDIEAEKVEVKSVLDQIVQAWETMDIEMVSKIFAHETDMVTFGTDPDEQFVGWKPLEASLQKQFDSYENPDVSVRDQLIKVSDFGNVAWFSEIMDINLVAQGEPVNVEGMRVTGVLEKRNGNWVIVQSHWSVTGAEQVIKY